MPVLQEKWINSPLTVIKDLFEKGVGNDDGYWGVNEYFESKLKTLEDFNLVPSLNLGNLNSLHDGCLVRYTGMVQDQFDPEFYFKVYHVTSNGSNGSPQQDAHCGLYSDLSHQPDVELELDHPSNVMADRQTLYCVPIPAKCQWVKDLNESCKGGAQLPESTNSHRTLKRKHDYEGEDGTEVGVAMEMGVVTEEEESNGGLQAKKLCSIPASMETGSDEQGHDLNLPIPGEKGLPCLVKLYRDFEAFSVGSVVEVVGVLGIDPTLAPLAYSDDTERKAHCPPPSLVPRLHAIAVRSLSHSNPLLPSDLPSPLQSDALTKLLPSEAGVTGGVESCRRVLLSMLTQALCGDSLAAEFTLLHLLSSVYGRVGLMALGKYSLNLSQWHGGAMTQTLYQLFQSVLTKCFLLPLTLDNMNSWRFRPKKDYDSNRLLSAVLQLSPGTEVLVDETVLTAGQLTQVGVANLTALGNVIQWQRLSYDFQFHATEFDCDLPVLVLSEGKSILKVDCHVPLVPADLCPVPTPSLQLLTALRKYLTLCRGLDYSLTDEMKEMLEKDFVKMRGNNPQVTGDEFHQLLCTARLLSLSHGSCSLNPQLWEHACQLEQERLERIRNMGS